MPYLHVRISGKEDSETATKVVSLLMEQTSATLGKKADVTSISVEFVPEESWFIGGVPLSAKNTVTFNLDIKITEGTNTKGEKAAYIQNVFSGMESILGELEAASYITIHDVKGDSWGFSGKTQEYRYIQSQI